MASILHTLVAWGDAHGIGEDGFYSTLLELKLPLVCTVIILSSSFVLFNYFTAETIPSYEVPLPKKADRPLKWDKPTIKVSGSSAIHCYAPATGEFLGLINPSSPASIDRAVELAHSAQKAWAGTTFTERRRVLKTMLKFVLANAEDLCRIACLDSGKTMIDGMLGEVLITAEKLTWTIKHGEKALKPSRRPTNLLMMYKRNTVYYEPLGVVAALVSWNYPFHNLIGPVMSAIFAGNGIVVKASENTAWSSNYFSLVARNALVACGHDPNLVQAVTCWPQTANYLTSHPGISHITFIGSREVAHHVAASAAKSLTPCVMELGGKDAAVILDSAASDLPRIVETLVRGTFQSSGQNCVGIERIIACPTVYDKVVSMLAERIPRIRVGSGLDAPPGTDIDMGAMVSPASFDRLESWIASAVQQGARLITGGKRYIHPVYKNGTYFQPTLLVDVTPAMEIAQEECFAPICIVMRAKSAEHAVAIANSTEYSLGASIFGAAGKERDLAVKNIKSGMVSVDDFAVYYAVQMPFGGVGGSGYGRFAGEEGLRGLCNLKSVCEDRLAWAGISTSIPPGLRYPIPHIRKALGFISGMMQFGYAPNLLDKVKGILKLLGNA